MTISKKDFFTVSCAPCRGYGVRSDKNHCLVCGGHGLMLVSGNIDEYADCPGCSGAGCMDSDADKVCGRCMGLGALRVRTA